MEESTTSSGATTSEREIFNQSGPLHLTNLDWTNFYHRRSIAASLVQGVRVLEVDRQYNRTGQQALAPPWWDFFHFHLVSPLIDDVDKSIFGAIYESKFAASNGGYSGQNVPRYIIAFRGTIKMRGSVPRDVQLDFLLVRNKLHESSRFQIAIQAVQNRVTEAGASNVWLAGHSLGSAIALLVGKNMVKMEHYIETYLFNPPFVSMEMISNERVKDGIRIVGNVIRKGLALTKNGRRQVQKSNPNPLDLVTDHVRALSAWVPFLFVNPGDHICSGYIRYFEKRKREQEIQTSQNSAGILFSAVDSEYLHLVPSAYLTINSGHTLGFQRAHGIHQWWDPEFNSQSELYR